MNSVNFSSKKGQSKSALTLYFDGRVDRIRTCDPLTPSQVRYQTAPPPECICYACENVSYHNARASSQLF